MQRKRMRVRMPVGIPVLFFGAFSILLVSTFATRTAAGRDDQTEDVPAGTVAFFLRPDGSCPSGFRKATEASGRMLVGVLAGDAVGKQVGMPLSNQEDRTHAHSFMA